MDFTRVGTLVCVPQCTTANEVEESWGIMFYVSGETRGAKMDDRHCFRGFKLSKPYVKRWGLKHNLTLDAVDWGIRT